MILNDSVTNPTQNPCLHKQARGLGARAQALAEEGQALLKKDEVADVESGLLR